jgi:hypothetical protein
MKLTTIVGVALLVGAGYAAADDPTPDMQSTDAQQPIIGESGNESTSRSTLEFKTLDSNQDGHLSRPESQQAGRMDFDAADRNGDGLIDRDEYSAAYERGLTAEDSVKAVEPHSQVGSTNTPSHQDVPSTP